MRVAEISVKNRSSSIAAHGGPIRWGDKVILVVAFLLLPSAVLHGFLGIDERTAFAAFLPLALLAGFAVKRLSQQQLVWLVTIASIVNGALASYVAQSFSQFLMGCSLAAAFIAGRFVFAVLINTRALLYISVFAAILLIGGAIGMAYAASGGQPLLELQVGDRATELYLTTFSLARSGDFVRPSGIFDEPGAFAMFIGLITIFNDVLRKNLRLNLLLVVLMIFTGSLAGLLLAVLYFLFSNGASTYRKKSMVVLGVLALSFLVVQSVFPSNLVSQALETFYTDRLRIEDGRFVGDNRSNQISDFLKLVDNEILIRGEKASELVYETSDMSSNPFSITFGYGLIISIPYFAILAWLLVVAMSGRPGATYASLGLLLLLLQRPYLYHMSWSVMICAAVFFVHYCTGLRIQHRRDWRRRRRVAGAI